MYCDGEKASLTVRVDVSNRPACCPRWFCSGTRLAEAVREWQEAMHRTSRHDTIEPKGRVQGASSGTHEIFFL
jgi:hypothetical protein